MSLVIRTFALLLPALLPSWRFFEEIAPSPRIEIALVPDAGAKSRSWRAFSPTPERVGVDEMIGRLFWNPRWSEHLYLITLSERLIDADNAHSREEIFDRVRGALRAEVDESRGFIQFRILTVTRVGEAIERHEVYCSPLAPLDADDADR